MLIVPLHRYIVSEINTTFILFLSVVQTFPTRGTSDGTQTRRQAEHRKLLQSVPVQLPTYSHMDLFGICTGLAYIDTHQ